MSAIAWSARPLKAPAPRRVLMAPALGIAAVLVLIRVYALWWYDISAQGNPDIHFPYLAAIIQLRTVDSYNAPYYYIVVAILSAPVAALYRLHVISESAFILAAATWSNGFLLAVYAFGCASLARYLGFQRTERFVYIGLCCLLPAIQRSFGTIRPENLILALSPWAGAFATLTWRAARNSVPCHEAPIFWPAVLSIAFMAAQKISGAVLSLGLTTVSFLMTPRSIRERVRCLGIAGVAVAVLTLSLIGINKLYGGWWPHQNKESMLYSFSTYIEAPPSVVISFDPVAAWNDPVRNTHKGSMWAMLAIDLFGDYWQHGYDYRATDPHSWRVLRARLGLVTTGVFFSLYGMGATMLVRRAWRSTDKGESVVPRERILLTTLFWLGPLFLALAALSGQYHPDKGDIFKWTYIVMFVPFLMLPPVHLLQTIHNRAARRFYGAMLGGIIFVGVLQSMWFPSLF